MLFYVGMLRTAKLLRTMHPKGVHLSRKLGTGTKTRGFTPQGSALIPFKSLRVACEAQYPWESPRRLKQS